MTKDKRVTLRWAGELEKGVLPETLPLAQWTTIGRDFTSLELLPEDVGFVLHVKSPQLLGPGLER